MELVPGNPRDLRKNIGHLLLKSCLMIFLGNSKYFTSFRFYRCFIESTPMYFLASFHYKIFGKRLFGKRDIPCNRMPAVINAITIIEYVSQIDKCKLQVQKPILNFILHTKICNICNIYCSISMRYFLHITL